MSRLKYCVCVCMVGGGGQQQQKTVFRSILDILRVRTKHFSRELPLNMNENPNKSYF